MDPITCYRFVELFMRIVEISDKENADWIEFMLRRRSQTSPSQSRPIAPNIDYLFARPKF